MITSLASGGMEEQQRRNRARDDERHYVDLTTFGFFQGGILDVRMINFKLPKAVKRGQEHATRRLPQLARAEQSGGA
ncbi:hypothetical protein MSG28_001174 [Choristoneura fumiferana]|uniref:Uncharacterized protein n=1 Tax=Choristoneura fumiferana TaxID=7141 RepID=A0ACC0K441_CHOFU|nr:hypothetical protein MSG28_001174 [Choristoneura fumiferana]